MNNSRRKTIALIIKDLEAIAERVEAVMDEEQEYFENMPEGIQQSERGDKSEEAYQNLDLAHDCIQEMSGLLEEASQ